MTVRATGKKMVGPGFKGYLRGFLITMVWCYPAFAQHEIKTVDGLLVMLAISSVEDIETKHPEGHPEMKMHGGPKGTHHLLIHLEDEKTERILTEASVSVDIHRPDGTSVKKKLEPMTINSLTDYGNYFDLQDIGNYHIYVLIKPRDGKVKKVSFVYEKRQGH